MAIRVEMGMRSQGRAVCRVGVSLLALALALCPAAMAEEPAPSPLLAGVAEREVSVPLPDEPAVLAVDMEAAGRAAGQNRDAAPPPVLAAEVVVPLPEEPAQRIVDQLAPAPKPALAAAPAVDIPPPDLPAVTVVIDPPKAPAAVASEALRDALKVYASDGGSRSPVPTARLGRKEREHIAAFYAARGDQPIWFDGDQATANARAAMAQIAAAEDDALDANAYPLPKLDALASADARATAEIALSAAAVAYARDARGARIEPSRLSNLITPDLQLPEPGAVLAALASAAHAGKALASYQPPHPGYLALKAKLHDMRESTASVRQETDELDGPPLRFGSADRRVPLIRARLSLPPKPDLAYDDDLIAAVKSFQRERRMRATGIFDQRTADLLSGRIRASSGIGIGDVIANMERWRWLPRDLGARHIEVNLPEFTLRLYENGKVIHRTRVVVGKTTSQTPIFSHMMDHVIVNPSWYVPPSILKNEILPKMAADPFYAERLGYEVIRRGNHISVRQPPGERNALGFIKFMFPNQHAVYLHDTPSRSLFANEKRAFSHGCVRVENPFLLADFVLGDLGYDEKRLRSLIGKGERTIRFKQALPIHLTYFTVLVDDAGRLVRRDDLYGHDGRVKTALGVGADGRRFAQNTAVPPPAQP